MIQKERERRTKVEEETKKTKEEIVYVVERTRGTQRGSTLFSSFLNRLTQIELSPLTGPLVGAHRIATRTSRGRTEVSVGPVVFFWYDLIWKVREIERS